MKIPQTQAAMHFPKMNELFSVNLYWSSPIPMTRNIDGVIQKYLAEGNENDIKILIDLFGRDRVLNNIDEAFLRTYHENQYGNDLDMSNIKIQDTEEYKNALAVIHSCE